MTAGYDGGYGYGNGQGHGQGHGHGHGQGQGYGQGHGHGHGHGQGYGNGQGQAHRSLPAHREVGHQLPEAVACAGIFPKGFIILFDLFLPSMLINMAGKFSI